MRCRGSGAVNTNHRGGGTRDDGDHFLQHPHHRHFYNNSTNGNSSNNYNHNQNRTLSTLAFPACNEYDNGCFEQPRNHLLSREGQEVLPMPSDMFLGTRPHLHTEQVTVCPLTPLSSSMRRGGSAASSGFMSRHRELHHTPMDTTPSCQLNMRSASNRYKRRAGMQFGSRFAFQSLPPASHHQEQQLCREVMYPGQRQDVTGGFACRGGYEGRNKISSPAFGNSHSLATCSSGGVGGFSAQSLQWRNVRSSFQPKKEFFVAKSLHQQRQSLHSGDKGFTSSLQANPQHAWNTRTEMHNKCDFHLRNYHPHSETHVGRRISGQFSEDIAVGATAQLQLGDSKRKGASGEGGLRVKQTQGVLENKPLEEKREEIKEGGEFQKGVASSSLLPQDEELTFSNCLPPNPTLSESSAPSGSQAAAGLCEDGSVTARLPPQLAQNAGRLTCCLDLDNTLVYTFARPPPWWEPEKNSLHLEIEFWMPAAFGRSSSEKKRCNNSADSEGCLKEDAAACSQHVGSVDETKAMENISESEVKPQKICVRHYVCIRPDAMEFVEFCIQKFEVVFFTSGTEEYACKIFDHLDPKHAAHRLYRHDCTMCEDGLYRKDLSILGRPVNSVILFDDRGPDVCFQPQNVLFCEPFILEEVDDAFKISTTDRELRAYMMFLDVLSGLEKNVIFKAIQMYNDELVKETDILLREGTQAAAVNTRSEEGG